MLVLARSVQLCLFGFLHYCGAGLQPSQGLVHASQAQPTELHSRPTTTTFLKKLLENIFAKCLFL